ncbi:MAG: ABC transporter permease [Chloroflexota bacterium]
MLTITHLTLHEALRRRVLLLALIMGLGFLVIFGLGFYAIISTTVTPAPRSITQGPQQFIAVAFLTMAGLYAVNFLLVMMAALMPVDTLSGEIRSGAIQSLVTKPIRRAEVVLGKWLGFWLILMGYLLLMAGGVILIAFVVSGYTPPNMWSGFALMMLEGTLLLTLSIAGGTRLSTLANGVMVFGLYGLAFIGGWVEQVSALLGNSTGSYVGIIASLIVPTESLWHLAAYQMQPAIMRELAITPFSPTSVPSDAMIFWALGYVAIALAWGVWQFGKRDL